MKELLVLGPGCPRCNKLYELTEQTAEELGIEFTLRKITDIKAISSYGVTTTPALIVDGEVKCVGKVPSSGELVSLIT